MTTEKTITGKIKELRYRTVSGTVDIDPYKHLEWILQDNGIQISDSNAFKSMVDEMFNDYNVTKDKKIFNHMFEVFTGMSFKDFLNDCLGGELVND